MNEPVLVATDFSARNDRAVDRALMLGKQLGREVVLAHILDGKANDPVDTDRLDSQMRACLPPGDSTVTFAYGRGQIGEALAATADEVGAAMLVVGVARYNAIGDYILGTAVDHVLRRCSQPVLVVKRRPNAPYCAIGVATDFSGVSRTALIAAANLFPDLPIHLINAYRVPFEGWQKAEHVKDQVHAAEARVFDEFMESVPAAIAARVARHMSYGGLHKAIAKVVEEQGVDLLVLGSHGESGFRHATLGSQASELLRTSSVDTMVVSPAIR